MGSCFNDTQGGIIMILTLEDYGRSLTLAKITPGDTLTSLSDDIWKYTERNLAFTSGGTTAVTVGAWIKGATSAATARVLEVTIDTGSWAGGDAAGTLRICSQQGTFTAAEKMTVGATADDGDITANSIPIASMYENKGQMARAAIVTAITNTALIDWSGAKPDQNSLMGWPVAAGSGIILTNVEAIKSLKIIDRVSGSASVVHVSCYF
jgi:hypothetical protein